MIQELVSAFWRRGIQLTRHEPRAAAVCFYDDPFPFRVGSALQYGAMDVPCQSQNNQDTKIEADKEPRHGSNDSM